LVPGGRGQDDVGVDAGARHAEVERDQQIELAGGRCVVPRDLARLLAAAGAEVLSLDAIDRAEEMLEKVFVALAARTEEVGAPDEEDARKARRVVRVFAGKAQRLRLECRGDEGGHLRAGGTGAPGDIEWIG